ncbi:hypothetical protein J2Z40_000046 [Cytobacillus eiseniae]|uniref:NERD domain-containing protein n=1 Tax=Cytobacillus eiseniae TaxID=762947 RepID=A0ABS4R9C9_9BACI|nr:nuclease-related domain-containing protein [Cytobacillus eiseniae]MBP2239493.1 hypothetical protein [Cytobacillus eiseniae]
MIYKPRLEPEELTFLNALKPRMTLSEIDRQQYYRLRKGYEGEMLFDQLTDKLQSECYIMNGLLLKVNNSTFQIDTLIIISGTIYLYEVKNYDGDYLYDTETDRIYKLPQTEYNNPLHQMNRTKSLLRQLLHTIGHKFPIESHVVFINPQFTLYQAPLNKHFIFPTQVTSHLRNLDAAMSSHNGTDRLLADKLVSLHIEKSPYTRLPSYKYEHLKTGVNCKFCHSFSIDVNGLSCICSNCGFKESVETAIVRTIKQIKLLNPNWKITTNEAIKWCGLINCRKRVSRILRKNFKIAGKYRGTYYE